MPDTPLRGRRGRDRRIAERIATEFAERHARPHPEAELDFDVAAVDAEVEDARREATTTAERPPAPPRPARPAVPPGGPPTGAAARKGGGQRIPDLSALPPLLAATGTFAGLRERLTPTRDGRAGRHIGLVAIPHGAKSYLAAALALAPDGERLAWIARDAEIGDRVAEELGAWLGDPAAVAVLEPRTALAYERSELIADETAARVAALAAWRSGRARVLVASVQALLQHTIAPADLPDAPRELRTGARLHQDALLHELFDLGYVPVSEVAGRGESARRGGIVDVFPPSLPLPIRIEFFGDEIDLLRTFDPTDQRTVAAIDRAVLLPRPSSFCPRAARPRSAIVSDGRRRGSPSGWPPTSPGSMATARTSSGRGPQPPAPGLPPPGARRRRPPAVPWPWAMQPRSGLPTSPPRPVSITSRRAPCS